jgi:hypothetical protein
MSMVCGLDVHRGQITFDGLIVETDGRPAAIRGSVRGLYLLTRSAAAPRSDFGTGQDLAGEVCPFRFAMRKLGGFPRGLRVWNATRPEALPPLVLSCRWPDQEGGWEFGTRGMTWLCLTFQKN